MHSLCSLSSELIFQSLMPDVQNSSSQREAAKLLSLGEVWYCPFTRNNLLVSHLSSGIQLLSSLQSHGYFLFANEMVDGWWSPVEWLVSRKKEAWLKVCKSPSAPPTPPASRARSNTWMHRQWPMMQAVMLYNTAPRKRERQQSYELPECLADSWRVGTHRAQRAPLAFLDASTMYLSHLVVHLKTLEYPL